VKRSRRQLCIDTICEPGVLSLLNVLWGSVQGTPKNAKQVEAAREKVGFGRSVDGRVVLKSNSGTTFQVKLDMGTAGVMLLRWVEQALEGLVRTSCVSRLDTGGLGVGG
jgi:hypothetical protein